MNTATLLITCKDQKGIVATISNFLYENNANILHSDQHHDSDQDIFFMRIEWSLDNFKVNLDDFDAAFLAIKEKYSIQYQLTQSFEKQRVVVFVSQYDHCLIDLLNRHKNNELNGEIIAVVSNHKVAEPLSEFYKIPFYYFDINKANKAEIEAKQLELMDSLNVDLIVLARYMQILSPKFVELYPQKIINIHHSFLPAFIGARPYHQAFERGVKIIGATSHYVTQDLDEGPIIEQGIERVSHRDQVEDLVKKGRELERVVLSRAVNWHLESRVLSYGNKTIIFD